MATLTAEPLSGGAETHRPAWELTTGTVRYVVWAPRPVDTPFVGNSPRTGWAAAVDDEDDEWASSFVRAATIHDVVKAFPPPVRRAFLTAAEEAEL